MGVCEYKLGDAIPEQITTALPSIEELEEELGKNRECSPAKHAIFGLVPAAL